MVQYSTYKSHVKLHYDIKTGVFEGDKMMRANEHSGVDQQTKVITSSTHAGNSHPFDSLAKPVGLLRAESRR